MDKSVSVVLHRTGLRVHRFFQLLLCPVAALVLVLRCSQPVQGHVSSASKLQKEELSHVFFSVDAQGSIPVSVRPWMDSSVNVSARHLVLARAGLRVVWPFLSPSPIHLGAMCLHSLLLTVTFHLTYAVVDNSV